MVIEFPIAAAFGYTLAGATRDVNADFRAIVLRVPVETLAPPGFARSHWKGNACRMFRCVFLS